MSHRDIERLDKMLRDVAREDDSFDREAIHGGIMGVLREEWQDDSKSDRRFMRGLAAVCAVAAIALIVVMFRPADQTPGIEIVRTPEPVHGNEISFPLASVKIQGVRGKLDDAKVYASLAENFTSSVTAPLRVAEGISIPLSSLHLPTEFGWESDPPG